MLNRPKVMKRADKQLPPFLPTKRWVTAKALLDEGENVYEQDNFIFFTRHSSTISEKLRIGKHLEKGQIFGKTLTKECDDSLKNVPRNTIN